VGGGGNSRGRGGEEMKMERRVEVGGKSDPWREAVIGKGVVAGDAIGNRN
jgi:hypothetical protein